MTRRPGEHEEPIDKAAERLKQFENARRPQEPEEEAEAEDNEQCETDRGERRGPADEKPNR